MPFKIVRNDITKMKVDAIVNTANEAPIYGDGVDTAVYAAAGVEELLAERKKIGFLAEGDVVITPGFRLPCKYIIHAVSPFYEDGESGEEELLRSCYKKSLVLALEYNCNSIAFPLISTGSFGYPKEEGMRIAIDEINAFLLKHSMDIYLVVFDAEATRLGRNLYPDLETYIDQNYVRERNEIEYGNGMTGLPSAEVCESTSDASFFDEDSWEDKESALKERMKHMSDTFQEYFLYLIESKGLTNTEVYKRAIITKQLFSKLKVNPDYHPDKATAMRLCVGAKLNLDETRDLLARAGYALSPCDKRDIIFSFFIEHEAWDMIEIDIVLEEHGLPCFIE
ncbi:MAG: macro domain-containing protein [Lachnospiraceae bacterium]|nr:macro domain-containing protein [Lachnospiraceae bacterium]